MRFFAPALAVAISLVACASDDGDGDGDGDGGGDGDGDGFDAEACRMENLVEVGRCVVEPTGVGCASPDEDNQRFEPVTEGSVIPITTSALGVASFPIAVRTPGVEPLNDDGPIVSATVLRGGEEVGQHYGRLAFTPIGDRYEALHAFVAIESGATALVGEQLELDVYVTCPDGPSTCGRVGFIAGPVE